MTQGKLVKRGHLLLECLFLYSLMHRTIHSCLLRIEHYNSLAFRARIFPFHIAPVFSGAVQGWKK